MFETFQRDQNYILRKSGISELVKATKLNVNEISKRSQKSLQDFIDELTEDQLDKLIDIYYPDFKLFNYPLPIRTHNASFN